MANNYELVIIDRLVTDLIVLSDDIKGKSTKAFQNGIEVVPLHAIKRWVGSLDSRARVPACAVLSRGSQLVEDSEGAPATRVQFERIWLGFAVVLRGPKDRSGSWREVLTDMVDLWNRVQIQAETSSDTLFAADTIADGPDGSYFLWGDEIERPDDLAEEFLFRGRMIGFGQHYGAGRTR